MQNRVVEERGSSSFKDAILQCANIVLFTQARYGICKQSGTSVLAEIKVCVGSFHHNVFINSVFVVVQGSISLHSLARLYIQMDMHFIRGIRAQGQPECSGPGAVVRVQSLAQGHLVGDGGILDHRGSELPLGYWLACLLLGIPA